MSENIFVGVGIQGSSHMTLYIDWVGCSNGMIRVSLDSIFQAISDLMVT